MTPNERNERVLNERAVNEFQREHERDLHRCHLWIVNEIIVSHWDYHNERPTVSQVKLNWRFDDAGLNDVTDDEILDIINRVQKFYD